MTDEEPRRLGDRLEHVAGLIGSHTPPAALEPDVDDLALVAEHLARVRTGDTWASRCPARFVDAKIDDFARGLAADLEAWVAGPPRNLVLLGPVGSGKSHAAYAVMHAMVTAGASWSGARVPKILEGLRPDRERVLIPWADVALLDDIGSETRSPWTMEQLEQLLDCRWADNVPTIATSNLAPDALSRWLGERAWSRLAGGAVVRAVTGDDRRFPDHVQGG